MKFLKEVYERNKILDQIFIDKFKKIDKDMYKNKQEYYLKEQDPRYRPRS